MNQRFQNEEKKCVRKENAGDELYKAINSIVPQFETELNEFRLSPEECFWDVRELLDAIADDGEDILPDIINIWHRKFNEYKSFDPKINDDELRKAVGIVLGFVILAVDSSSSFFYRRKLTEGLTEVIADDKHCFDGWVETLERIFSIPLPDGWFDAYIISEDEIKTPNESKPRKAGRPPITETPFANYLINEENEAEVKSYIQDSLSNGMGSASEVRDVIEQLLSDKLLKRVVPYKILKLYFGNLIKCTETDYNKQVKDLRST